MAGTLRGCAVSADVTEGRDRFVCLDAVRAIAALLVLVTHAAFWAGRYERGAFAAVLARLDIGVALFFVLSGFLLYRPFALARARGDLRRSFTQYARHRAARILPAFWVVTALVLVIEPAARGAPEEDRLRQVFLLQTVGPRHQINGLTQTWSLAVEVAFYISLPFIVVAIDRLCGNDWRPGRILLFLAGLCALNIAWLVVVHSSDKPFVVSMTLWLPGYLAWFAAGMAIAVLSVQLTEHGTDLGVAWRTSIAVGHYLPACWLVSMAFFALATTPLAGPRSLITSSTGEGVTRMMLYGLAASTFVLPLALSPRPNGAVQRAMATGSLRWLGTISYSIFLVHVALLNLTYWMLDLRVFTGSLAVTIPVLVALTLPSATVLYYLVERPTRRWARRTDRRPIDRVNAAAVTRATAAEDSA